MQDTTLYQLFEEVFTGQPEKLAYRTKQGDGWIDRTWGEVGETVHRVARSLIALGVKPGDRVAVLSGTRLEWVLTDFGIVSCGGVTVGIYHSNLAEDCAYIIEHSDAGIVFVEDQAQLEKILSVRSRFPDLRHVILFSGRAEPGADVLGWEEFLSRGEGVDEEERQRRGEAIRPDDLASLVYTSGTTGVPKGAMITHDNLVFTCETASECLDTHPHYITLFFLPLAHVFARLIAYVCMSQAVAAAFAEDITTLPQNLKEIRPHFFVSVPRVYEKVYDKIISGAESAGGLKLKLFNWAVRTGSQVSKLQQQKQPVPALLGLKRALAHRLVFQKIQEALGGRLVWAVSGAAPLNRAIAEFFHACGVSILEGIGMTENTSFTNVNRLDNNRFGTVGQVGPGIEMKIAPDGEVMYRGRNVMKGYFKNPEATAEAITPDGWLLTGDIGVIEEGGFLRITDRKKDLIITAGGKNVAPQRIERILRTSHYVGQVMAYGDKRKYISALITLDPLAIRKWADEQGLAGLSLEELAVHPRVRELIGAEVEQRNRQLASFETVKRFHILAHDFSIEGGELTPTMKIKRKVVTQKYLRELEALYAE